MNKTHAWKRTEKTYTWKRIPPPEQIYMIDGVPVTAAEFLAEHERRAAETLGFVKENLGEPWAERESPNPETHHPSASRSSPAA